MRRIKKVYVANRGEVAVHIIRACRRLGVQTVVGVSEADRYGMAAMIADEAVVIGAAAPKVSYLDINANIECALRTGCDAIHPGYGFLAENARFAAQCQSSGLIFIGPDSASIESLGDKEAARQLADEAGVPTVPGENGVTDVSVAKEVGRRIGYPIMIKAAAGGGGRGIRVVRSEEEIAHAFTNAMAEAGAVFGDSRLYIEKYVQNARHIEVQIAGDESGRTLHFGERDCTSQRRNQKIIEESPSPVLDAQTRQRLCLSAVQLAEHCGYKNLGTVEFIYDVDTNEFYFMEMNTRLQVEYPVTEACTNIDLIELSIRIADGEPIPFNQDDITHTGHAVECRINAEDPKNGFAPSPGAISNWRPTDLPNVKVNSHCYPGLQITPFYDSLIAKVVAWGETRDQAIEDMALALEGLEIEGIRTTKDLCMELVQSENFRSNSMNTQWVEKYIDNRKQQ